MTTKTKFQVGDRVHVEGWEITIMTIEKAPKTSRGKYLVSHPNVNGHLQAIPEGQLTLASAITETAGGA